MKHINRPSEELQETNDKIYGLVRRCGRCGGVVRREKNLDYPYYCPNCDENLYNFEVKERSVD